MKRFIALTALIAATALPVLAQQIDAIWVWSSVAGTYTTSVGNNAVVTLTGDKNQNIVVSVSGANRQAGEYVDIPLIFHLYGTGTIAGWDSATARFRYDNSRIDVGAYREPTTGNFQLYWFSTFAGTGATGTFSALRMAMGVPSPLLGGARGQIYEDPAPGVTDFAVTVTHVEQADNGFAPDYNQPGSEASQKGIIATRNGANNAANRRPLFLRVFIDTQDFNYSPVFQDQSLLYNNLTTRGRIGFEGSISVVPEPASMIALGSGLVGLLALRRRKK